MGGKKDSTKIRLREFYCRVLWIFFRFSVSHQHKSLTKGEYISFPGMHLKSIHCKLCLLSASPALSCLCWHTAMFVGVLLLSTVDQRNAAKIPAWCELRRLHAQIYTAQTKHGLTHEKTASLSQLLIVICAIVIIKSIITAVLSD